LEDLGEFQKVQVEAYQTKTELQRWTVKILLALFVLTVVVELSLVLFAAAGSIDPDPVVLLAPAATAVPQVPVLLLIVFKWLFPRQAA
ncbi:MAG: hypothetical protein V3U31_06660, partial [Dehalococcoidia bacterium]